MSTDVNSFLKFTKNLEQLVEKNKVFICEASFFNCKFCHNKLIYTTSSNCVVFTLNAPKKGLLRSKMCKLCGITYTCDSYYQNNISYSYDVEMISLVVTSSQSVFEVQLLKDFDKHLVRNAITFSGWRL